MYPTPKMPTRYPSAPKIRTDQNKNGMGIKKMIKKDPHHKENKTFRRKIIVVKMGGRIKA
jgi:hypothetical protein